MKTSIRIKDCDVILSLSPKELNKLLHVLVENSFGGKGLTLGAFSSSIGTGVIARFDKETFDITDYGSW